MKVVLIHCKKSFDHEYTVVNCIVTQFCTAKETYGQKYMYTCIHVYEEMSTTYITDGRQLVKGYSCELGTRSHPTVS
jgi:hypothetical protein